MDPTLVIILALPWLLIFLDFILRRNFMALLGWVLLAPGVTYLLQVSPRSSLYHDGGATLKNYDKDFYLKQATNITVQELLDPTRLLFILLFTILVLTVLLKKTRYVPPDRTEIWMSIFSVILLANVLLWSNRLVFGLRVAVDCFIVPFLAYFVARRLVTSDHRLHQLLHVLGYMGVFLVLFCLIERLITPGLFYRLRGPFTSTNVLYVITAVVFFTAFLDSAAKRSEPHNKATLSKGIRWFLLLMSPAIIALNLTRGDWLGFLLALGTFWFLGHPYIDSRRRSTAVALISILPIILGIFLLSVVPAEFFEGRIGDTDNWVGRLATWKAILVHIQQAPFLGLGLNNLQAILGQQNTLYSGIRNYSTTHNSYLALLGELGLVGLFAYLAVISSIIKSALKLYRQGICLQDRWRGITLLAIIIAYQIPSLFGNTLYIPEPSHAYVYVLAGAIASLNSKVLPFPSRRLALEGSQRISIRDGVGYQYPARNSMVSK
jgi:O-antigen ligase